MYGKSITAVLANALVLGMGARIGTESIHPREIWPDVPVAKPYGTRGAGITMAQQQRAARKARNVKRHKRSVRG